MTSRNPTREELDAHAARVRQDREAAQVLERCRDCDAVPEINPRTGRRFVSCAEHRAADRARKNPNGKR